MSFCDIFQFISNFRLLEIVVAFTQMKMKKIPYTMRIILSLRKIQVQSYSKQKTVYKKMKINYFSLTPHTGPVADNN